MKKKKALKIIQTFVITIVILGMVGSGLLSFLGRSPHG